MSEMGPMSMKIKLHNQVSFCASTWLICGFLAGKCPDDDDDDNDDDGDDDDNDGDDDDNDGDDDDDGNNGSDNDDNDDDWLKTRWLLIFVLNELFNQFVEESSFSFRSRK